MDKNTKDKKSPLICSDHEIDLEAFWLILKEDADRVAKEEETLKPLLTEVVINHHKFSDSLATRLARKLSRDDMPQDQVRKILCDILEKNPDVLKSVARDLQAIFDRDPACNSILEPLLFFKGFHAITNYRISHLLWKNNRRSLALYFQSIGSEIFQVDIHPAAKIGCGIMLDHATSFVVGETGVIEDNVSILHEVTLGGTGKESGLRHPIVRSGVLIGAGTKILGRVEIGANAKIGAGSVVLENVAPNTTVVGVPAKLVGSSSNASPAYAMDQSLECEKLYISSLDSAAL